MDEPYRMILVDDEDEERGRISSKISEKSGFTVVGTAGNGYDALELIERHQPHIVLADIKMPFIDGLELAALIRQDWPTVRVAFITGFDEFEYARKAVELRASGYLMKPVTQDDISSFLDRLRAELDEEFRVRYDLDILKTRYERSLPLMLDDSLVSLLTGSRPLAETELEELDRAGLSFDGVPYALAILEPGLAGPEPSPGAAGGVLLPADGGPVSRTSGDAAGRLDPLAAARLRMTLRSLADDILSRHGFSRHSAAFNETVVFAVRDPGANFMKKLDNALYEILRTAERYLGASVYVGASEPFDPRDGLRSPWRSADRALAVARRNEGSGIAYAPGPGGSRPAFPPVPEAEIRALESAARSGTDEDYAAASDSLRFSVRTAFPKDGAADLRPAAIALFAAAARLADGVGLDPGAFLGEEAFERTRAPGSPESLCDWALSLFSAIRSAASRNRQSGAERIVDRFRALVAERYADPLFSLDSACDALAVSASYISLLLKRHLGTTFTAYLTAARMERAKDLLRHSDSLVLEIAERCGYRDVYYFSHIFKKYAGEAPKKYRETVST